jgi:cysteine-rich repeat protein
MDMLRQAAFVFGFAAVALSACNYDWNSFDPRRAPITLGPAGSGGGGGGGSAGGGSGGVGGQGGVVLPRCGDGVINPGEQCDDGGTSAGDGCDGTCNVECSELFDDSTSHCYTFLPGMPATWDAAHAACRALGPGWDLVGVSSQTEHDWLTAQPTIDMSLVDDDNTTSFWTGGSDAAVEGTWIWSNGEPFFDNWITGEPNNDSGGGGGGAGGADPGEDCVVYVRRSAVIGYDDRGCDRQYAAVCELTPAGSQ